MGLVIMRFPFDVEVPCCSRRMVEPYRCGAVLTVSLETLLGGGGLDPHDDNHDIRAAAMNALVLNPVMNATPAVISGLMRDMGGMSSAS